MKAVVVLNEQHQLKADQERILNERFDSFEVYPVPAEGWTLSEISRSTEYPYNRGRVWQEIVDLVYANASTKDKGGCVLWTYNTVIVFASPIPVLLMNVAREFSKSSGAVFVFHNDSRVKRELPNGKVISVIADEGWVLV